LNFDLLRTCFFATAAVVVLLLPCDVLANYFIPVASIRPSKDAVRPLSFEEPSESTDAYRQALASTRAFGKLAATFSLGPMAGSIDEILSQLRLKGIFSLSGRDAIVEDRQVSKTVFLKEGDKYKNLAVKTVGEESVVFTDGVNEREIKITAGDR
jgi:hypothetical protein